MDVQVGQTSSEYNKVNKSFTNKHTYDCIFTDADCFSITEPVIKIKISDITSISNCNYMYIKDLKRYYYISDITSENGIAIIKGEVDVLKSFADDILSSSQLVMRSQNNKSAYIQDNQMPIESDVKIESDVFGSAVFNKACGRVILETTGRGGAVT